MQELQLTPTSYMVLGLLMGAGEARTPYQLKQMADSSVGHFWSLPRSQLYAEPARLAQAGYLTEEQEPDGRRRKRYALTRRGKEALAQWLDIPTYQYTELRDLAFLKVFFGADPAAMAEAQLAALRPLLETYEAMRDADTAAIRSGPRYALEAGLEHVKTAIQIWEGIARAAPESNAALGQA